MAQTASRIDRQVHVRHIGSIGLGTAETCPRRQHPDAGGWPLHPSLAIGPCLQIERLGLLARPSRLQCGHSLPLRAFEYEWQ